MIQVFRGNNPHYLQQFNDIQYILYQEHFIKLSESMASDVYIYWCNPDYFASGFVRLALDQCNNQFQFIVRNLVFHIDYNLYQRDLDFDDYHELDEQIGGEFFKAMYLKLYDMVKHQRIDLTPHQPSSSLQPSDIIEDTIVPTPSTTQLLMELSGEEFIDCVSLGYWPCSDEEEFGQMQYRTILSLTSEDRKVCLHNLKRFCTSYSKGRDN